MVRRARRWSLLVAIGFAGLVAAPAMGAPRAVEHGMLESFDGTAIAYSLFLPEAPSRAPVIFHTHGWGGSRVEEPAGIVRALLDEGYAVVTWDARGFGDSGGEANVDSQEFEVRDVRALVDLVAAHEGIQLDAPGDPRMGMVGASYAGGIQLMTAAADARVDAIVPQIAWHDLVQSLLPNGVVKLGWGSLLYGGGAATGSTAGVDAPGGPQTGVYARQIHEGFAQGLATNGWSEEIEAWFDARSPAHYIGGGSLPGLGIARAIPGIRSPALIIQGASDTLFNLNQGIANFRAIQAGGVEARLLIFCGGHTLNAAGTSCATDPPQGPSQAEMIQGAILAWFDRHVRDPLGDASPGPPVRYQLQDGRFVQRAALPNARVAAKGGGRLVGAVAPTSGALTAGTPSRDGVRFEVPVRPGEQLLGIPRATVGLSGSGPEAHLFFKLLDVGPDGTAVVIDDQVMALRVTGLSGEQQRRSLDLAGVSWEVREGHRVMVEISSSSNDHNGARVPWFADVAASVTLPVARPETRVLGTGARGTPGRVLPATGGNDSSSEGLALLAGAIVIAVWSRRRHCRDT